MKSGQSLDSNLLLKQIINSGNINTETDPIKQLIPTPLHFSFSGYLRNDCEKNEEKLVDFSLQKTSASTYNKIESVSNVEIKEGGVISKFVDNNGNKGINISGMKGPVDSDMRSKSNELNKIVESKNGVLINDKSEENNRGGKNNKVSNKLSNTASKKSEFNAVLNNTNKSKDSYVNNTVSTSKKGKFSYLYKELRSKKPYIIPLQNYGYNTCYINSVLQCLMCTPPFNYFLLMSNHKSICQINEKSGENEAKCFLCWFISFYRKYEEIGRNGRSEGVLPKFILKNMSKISPNLSIYQEEDAHEFLLCLLDALEKNYNNFQKIFSRLKGVSYKAPKLNSLELIESNLIQNIFGGLLKSDVKCLGCGKVSGHLEGFCGLSLEIKGSGSVEECLEKFCKGEELTGDEKLFCESCNSKQNARKVYSIYHCPNILILQLKRFDNFGRKIIKDIKYREFINIEKYTKSIENNEENVENTEEKSVGNQRKNVGERHETQVKTVENSLEKHIQINNNNSPNSISHNLQPPINASTPYSHWYRLYAVINHLGYAEFGHYYNVIRQKGKRWQVNDEDVKEVKEAKESKESKGEKEEKEVKNALLNTKLGYMFFYRKVTEGDFGELENFIREIDEVIERERREEEERRRRSCGQKLLGKYMRFMLGKYG